MLLAYLKENDKVMDIKFDMAVIKRESIDHFEFYDNFLYILTKQCNEFWFDISRYKNVVLDVPQAFGNEFDIMHCLQALADERRFNACLAGDNDKSIVDFMHIH
jgi:hypothetical protein